MKLFLDTANLDEIQRALESGCISGVTTNPSLMAKEPKSDYLTHLSKIVDLLGHSDISLSVETFSDDPETIIDQAKQFSLKLSYPHLAVKVHIDHGGKNNLSVVSRLEAGGISVNCTACMTPMQAMMAASAGARYVSLFYNRIKDGLKQEFSQKRNLLIKDGIVEKSDFDPDNVIRETRTLIRDCSQTEIIVGSIRTTLDIKRAGLAGAHIVTVPPKILWQATRHFQTDNAVERFFKDFQIWIS